MNRRIAAIILVLIVSIGLFTSCKKEDDLVLQLSKSDGVLIDLNEPKDFLVKISDIKENTKIEDLKRIFGAYPRLTGSGEIRPTYSINQTDFTIDYEIAGSPDNMFDRAKGGIIYHDTSKKSIITISNGELKKIEEESKKLDSNTKMVESVEQGKSDGIISMMVTDKLFEKLTMMDGSESVQLLIKLFGKAPKNTSTDEQTKFTYLMGDVEITFFNAPFTHFSLSVPGENIELFFNWIEED